MEEIERRAESILAELPDYVWDGDRPPIPVEEIADSHFGLHVCDKPPAEMRSAPGCPPIGDDETLSGLLLPSLGQIWVNADEAVQWPPRRRFTIAHELGHWVLHRNGPAGALLSQGRGARGRGAGDDAGALPVTEQEANAFAAALLMPAPPDRALLPPDERQLRAALPRVQVERRRDGAAAARRDLRDRSHPRTASRTSERVNDRCHIGPSMVSWPETRVLK